MLKMNVKDTSQELVFLVLQQHLDDLNEEEADLEERIGDLNVRQI